MYICPVCGYEKLEDPPQDFNICCCCGTEFGFDDFETPYEVLRSLWLERGHPWFSPTEGPPALWNPFSQLNNLQYLQRPSVSSRTEQQQLLAMTA
jgi:hypothetical protein